MVTLKPITILDDNMRECIDLEVTEEQQNYVAHNAESLGEAYALNKKDGVNKAAAYSIHHDGEMVGFIMYGYFEAEFDDDYPENHYYFWRFMLDVKHQNKGYGRQAMGLLLDEIKQKPYGHAEYAYTSYEPKNVVAKKLYESFGFIETGKIAGGELVSRLKI